MKYIKLYEQREPQHKVYRRSDGSVWIEAWSQNGKRHREDGPASIEYRPSGSVKWESWWLDNQWLKDVTSQEEFEAWKYLKSVGLV